MENELDLSMLADITLMELDPPTIVCSLGGPNGGLSYVLEGADMVSTTTELTPLRSDAQQYGGLVTAQPSSSGISRGSNELRVLEAASSNSSDCYSDIMDTQKPTSKTRCTFASKLNRIDFESSTSPDTHGGKRTSTARFQCRRCGLTNFLCLTSVGLPMRICICGSTSIVVSSWVNNNSAGLAGGNFGHECFRCLRCQYLYCSARHLQKHKCRPVPKQSDDARCPSSLENSQWPGVPKVPTCSYCGDSFVFQLLLNEHVTKFHHERSA